MGLPRLCSLRIHQVALVVVEVGHPYLVVQAGLRPWEEVEVHPCLAVLVEPRPWGEEEVHRQVAVAEVNPCLGVLVEPRPSEAVEVVHHQVEVVEVHPCQGVLVESHPLEVGEVEHRQWVAVAVVHPSPLGAVVVAAFPVVDHLLSSEFTFNRLTESSTTEET